MPTYDPQIIQSFASRLYGQAQRIVVVYTLFFGLVGFFGTTVIFMMLPKVLATEPPFWVVLGLAMLGCILGHSIGNERAFKLRLQAQTALCQAQIEANTHLLVQERIAIAEADAGDPDGPGYVRG